MEVKKLSLKEIGYKKLILLFLAGVLLIFLSINDFANTKEDVASNSEENAAGSNKVNTAKSGDISEDLERLMYETEYYEGKLENIIQNIKGVSTAKVMLTLEQSSEKVVLKDTPVRNEAVNEADNAGGVRNSSIYEKEENTILVSNEEGDSVPYALTELNAKISGVIILIKADGNGIDVLSISAAVESLFNIPAHRIEILEMK